MAKQFKYSEEARQSLKALTISNAIKITLGPKGRNVVLERITALLITNDGVTIAKNSSSKMYSGNSSAYKASVR